VNNVGATLHGPLDLAEFSQILRFNVVGLLTVTHTVLPAMRERGFGRIVNISSGTTRRVAVGNPLPGLRWTCGSFAAWVSRHGDTRSPRLGGTRFRSASGFPRRNWECPAPPTARNALSRMSRKIRFARYGSAASSA